MIPHENRSFLTRLQGFFAAPQAVAPVTQFIVDPNLTGDEWTEMARNDPSALLSTLLEALAAPNPVSPGGRSVEEAFRSHIQSIAPNQTLPSLYSTLKTFWLPSSPAYFSLTASAGMTAPPSEHRFIYWDPLPLVFNGIPCPHCGSPLINRGRITTGPLKIYDIEKPFFIIGSEYLCRGPQCTQSSPEGRKYASTDASILRALPTKLKDEFPAKLTFEDGGSGTDVWNWKACGVSLSLWKLVRGGLRAGVKKEVILMMIHSVQYDVPEEGAAAAKDVTMSEPESSQEQPVSEDSAPPSFNNEYTNAWNEYTAVAEKPPPPPPPVSTPATAPTPPTAAPLPPPPVNSPPQQQHVPYTYHFTPYGYLPPTLVNGQMVPVPMPMHSHQPSEVPEQPHPQPHAHPQVPPPPHPHAHRVPHPPPHPIHHPLPPPPAAATEPLTQKRSPRHCCKCGSQDCKGKGGRNFCHNPCQDCGKMDCKGRNSRRPDKKCSEGWN